MRIHSIAILLLLILIANSCDMLKKEESKNMPSKTVVVLCDLTESTRNFHSAYLENLKTILSTIRHGDVIVAAKITNSSIAELEIPIKDEIQKFIPVDKMGNPTDNPILVKSSKKEADDKLSKQKELIIDKLNNMFSANNDLKRKILNTDIMSSLHVAEKIFKSYKREELVLVMLSDMIEDSTEYDFEKENLIDKRAEEIIKKEKTRNRIPDLQGVKVYVVAAGTKESNRFFAIQNFWLRYFKECGADLTKERYGSALLNFNE